jgi:phage tail sheath gpL-like
MATEEESPESGEEAAEELTADDVATILDDAEALIRTGAEKIDYLIEQGLADADLVRLRDTLDKAWGELQVKVAAMDEED